MDASDDRLADLDGVPVESPQPFASKAVAHAPYSHAHAVATTVRRPPMARMQTMAPKASSSVNSNMCRSPNRAPARWATENSMPPLLPGIPCVPGMPPSVPFAPQPPLLPGVSCEIPMPTAPAMPQPPVLPGGMPHVSENVRMREMPKPPILPGSMADVHSEMRPGEMPQPPLLPGSMFPGAAENVRPPELPQPPLLPGTMMPPAAEHTRLPDMPEPPLLPGTMVSPASEHTRAPEMPEPPLLPGTMVSPASEHIRPPEMPEPPLLPGTMVSPASENTRPPEMPQPPILPGRMEPAVPSVRPPRLPEVTASSSSSAPAQPSRAEKPPVASLNAFFAPARSPFLSMVPIPGMAPLTLPIIPPVPGMPTIPLSLDALHVPSMVIPSEKWEEFEAEEFGIKYYHNRSTKVSLWIPPAGSKIIRSTRKGIGRVDSWEHLTGGTWVRVKTTTGWIYFHNKKTDELCWECPEGVCDEVDDGEDDAQSPCVPQREAASSSSECGDAEEQQRRADFAELLREKNISDGSGTVAIGSYERAIPRLCNDARFLAIPSNQRRALFALLVKEGKTVSAQENRDRKAERMAGLRQLLREPGAHDIVVREWTAPVDCICTHLATKYGRDERWKHTDEQERGRVVSEAVAKYTAEVDKKKKTEREEFAVKVDAFLARIKESLDLPTYNIARDELSTYIVGVVTHLTELEKAKIYNARLGRRRDVMHARQKRVREVAHSRSDMDSLRTKRQRLDMDEDLLNCFLEKCKNPWSDVSWHDYVDSSTVDRTEEELDELWADFKKKLVAMRQRLFLQQLRLTFDRESTFVLKDISAVVRKINMPLLSCVPEKYLVETMDEFNREIASDAKEAFLQYLKTSTLFANADALEEKGRVFEELMDHLSKHKLYRRLNSCPAEREDMVRAWVVQVKNAKAEARAQSKVVEED